MREGVGKIEMGERRIYMMDVDKLLKEMSVEDKIRICYGRDF